MGKTYQVVPDDGLCPGCRVALELIDGDAEKDHFCPTCGECFRSPGVKYTGGRRWSARSPERLRLMAANRARRRAAAANRLALRFPYEEQQEDL